MIRLLESVLPGLRDTRTPLVAGIVWLLLIWMRLADQIPDPATATGFLRQVYMLAAAVGSGPMTAALSIAAYLVGVLGVTLGDALAGGVVALHRCLQWQRQASRTMRAERERLSLAQAKLQAATGTPQEHIERKAVERCSADLKKLTSARRVILFRRTVEAVSLVESRRPPRPHQLAETAARNAWNAGVEDGMSRLQTQSTEVGDGRGEDQVFAEHLIRADLGGDPLEALRALDDGLYQALDRERAERDFRIGVMPAVVAFSVALSTEAPATLLLAALATWTFFRSALRQSRERAEVLSQILLKGLSLPSLRAAEFAGRLAVREEMAEAAKAVARGQGAKP